MKRKRQQIQIFFFDKRNRKNLKECLTVNDGGVTTRYIEQIVKNVTQEPVWINFEDKPVNGVMPGYGIVITVKKLKLHE
jgi:hypothetical protein